MASASLSTCGFTNGIANQPRTADLGFSCRSDVEWALWGFCPPDISAQECGFPGSCVDAHSCSNGCGITGSGTLITTLSCTSPGADYCSTALLIAQVNQIYTSLACANAAATVSLLLEATTTLSEPTASTSTPSKTSSTSASTASQTSSPPNSITQSPNLSTSSTPTPSISNLALSTSSSSSNNVGAIVGGVIGGLALLCFVVFAFVFLRQFRRGSNGATVDGAGILPIDDKEKWPRNGDYHDVVGRQTLEHQYWVKPDPVELSGQPKSPVELAT